jgi:DivIVA domain-containing protein
MPLTPADVHNVFFKKPPMGKRGYDEDEVDAFLDVVEAELVRLVEENAELVASRADAVADERPGAPATAGPALAQRPADDSVRASRMLALATETADRFVSEAEQQAEQMVASAKSTSQQMVSEAGARSEQMVGEAEMRAHSMISDASTRAATMEREARAKAAALDQDAERRHREVMGPLKEERSSLELKIQELRTSEREYRTRLRSYLESLLRDLDRRGSAEPASDRHGSAEPTSDTRQGQPVNA